MFVLFYYCIILYVCIILLQFAEPFVSLFNDEVKNKMYYIIVFV